MEDNNYINLAPNISSTQNFQIPLVNHVKYLGVIIDKHAFKLDTVTAKAVSGFLQRSLCCPCHEAKYHDIMIHHFLFGVKLTSCIECNSSHFH